MPTFEDPKVEALYQNGLIYIEKIRSQNSWVEGFLQIPFVCYGCAKPKTNLCLTTGDGLPMCVDCFEACAGALAGFNPST